MEKQQKDQKSRIKLIVGGTRFETTRTTLSRYASSMLESLVSGRHAIEKDDEGYIFIDRDGSIFRIILNSMRNGKLMIPPDFLDFDLLAAEIDFYCLPFVVPFASSGIADFTRRELGKLLKKKKLDNLDGVRLCGLDLSGLRIDVSMIGADLSCAKLVNSTISKSISQSIMCGADLTGVTIDSITSNAVNFTRAILVRARIRSSNLFESNFERVNMNEAIFNCNLQKTTFTNVLCEKTNFEESDFSGSNRQGTNFSTADLTRVIGLGNN